MTSGSTRVANESATHPPARSAHASPQPRLVSVARRVIRVEVGYAILLISVFVLPYWTNELRVPALIVAVALAAGHALRDRARPVVPLVIVFYLGVYALVGLHTDREILSMVDAGQLIAPPIFALALAWAAGERAVRRSLILMTIAAAALQIPVVIYQSADLIADLGRDAAVVGVDRVTGLLGDHQASTLAEAGLLAAILLLAAGCVGAVRLRWAVSGTVALLLLSSLSSTRVNYVIAPIALAFIAAALWGSRRGRSGWRGPALVTTALALVTAPLLFLGTGALYPGANANLLNEQGFNAVITRGDQQLDDPTRSGADGAGRDGSGRRSRATALPGRKTQLTTAIDLSVADGLVIAAVGRGIGSTELESPLDPIVRPEQNTATVWIARTISEAGWLGVAAFLSLLGYLLVLWWRCRGLVASGNFDSALVLGLPAIAALTLLFAFYDPILIVRPYSTMFWALFGVAIAIDASRRSKAPG
jgi:hypothetical protein